MTIHDLAWIFYPQAFTWFNRNFLRLSTWFAVKSASKIIAVSEATKKDLTKTYKVDGSKIAVVHHGYELEKSGQSVRRSLGEGGDPLINLPKDYILFLSTLQPRKNLEGLIKAFRQLKQDLPELPHKLVVAGKPGWKFESILKTIEDNKDIAVYLNHVSEAEKSAILLKAAALVLPSFYEGFGMQILEAFAAGVPVAASNVSSLPEVAGEAAVYFDPKDTSQIKSAIKNILLDRGLADRLREKGKERLEQFSWRKSAKETLEVLIS